MTHRCGAKTRVGRPCRAPVIRGKNRCRMHGGLSTGPKTKAGRERVREGYRRYLIKDLEQRELDRAAGHYAPYYRGADMALRARYGTPSDRRRLTHDIVSEPAKVDQHHQKPVQPEAEYRSRAKEPLRDTSSSVVLQDWDPFDL